MSGNKGPTVSMGNMNWELLRQQKRSLVELRLGSVVTAEQAESIEGMINFLDYIQDQVVDTGQATEIAVFGDMKGK